MLTLRRSVEERPSGNGVADVLPGEARVLEAAHRSLSGERHGLRALWPFLGSAFIAAVACLPCQA
jgi:hypothetical protein